MTSSDRPDAWRPADRSVRLVRSVAAAVVCVTAAGVGHASAGGAMPAAAAIAAFAGSAAVAWVLSARRVTGSQLLGLLLLCQVGVHFGASTGEMSMGATMIAAHVAATALSVVALSRGEAFVWQLAQRLGLRAAPLMSAAPALPSTRQPVAVVVPRARHDIHLMHARSLRGPPVSLV